MKLGTKIVVGFIALYVGLAALGLLIAALIKFTQFWLDVLK